MQYNPANVLIVFAGPMFFGNASASDSGCKSHYSQVEMNACSGEDLKRADDEMDRLYQQQMEALKKEANKKRLVEAQKAWLIFRDATCLYEEGPREESGTIWPLAQNRCLEELTKRRVTELEAYVNCTKDPCPH